MLYIHLLSIIANPPSIWPWVHTPVLNRLKTDNNSEQVYRSLITQIFKLTGDIDELLGKWLRFTWWSIYYFTLSILWTIIIYYIHDDLVLLMLIILPSLSFILGISLYSYYKYRLQKIIKKWRSMNE